MRSGQDGQKALLDCSNNAASRFWYWLWFYSALALAWCVLAYVQPAETFENVRRLSVVAADVDALHRRLVQLSGVYKTLATKQYLATDPSGRGARHNSPYFSGQIEDICALQQKADPRGELYKWCNRNWAQVRTALTFLDAIYQKTSAWSTVNPELGDLGLSQYHESVDELIRFNSVVNELSQQLRQSRDNEPNGEALFLELYPPWKDVQDAGIAEAPSLDLQIRKIQAAIPFITAMLRVKDMGGARSDILGRAGIQHDRALAMMEIPGIGNPVSVRNMLLILPLLFFSSVFIAHANALRARACAAVALQRSAGEAVVAAEDPRPVGQYEALASCLLPQASHWLPSLNTVWALACQVIALVVANYFLAVGLAAGDHPQSSVAAQFALLLLSAACLLYGDRAVRRFAPVCMLWRM